MKYVTKYFKFDSAHHLPFYPGKCIFPHGHSWKLGVSVNGFWGDNLFPTMIADFSHLKQIVDEKIISKLDHTDLNVLIEMPTAENIVEWIKEQLCPVLGINLCKIELWETEDSCCIWER